MYDKITYAVTGRNDLSNMFITNGIDRRKFREVFGFCDEEQGVQCVNGLVFLVEQDGSIDAVGPGTCAEWYSIGIGYLPSRFDEDNKLHQFHVDETDRVVAAINYMFSSTNSWLSENPTAIVHVDKEQEFLAVAQALGLSPSRVADGKPLEDVVPSHNH